MIKTVIRRYCSKMSSIQAEKAALRKIVAEKIQELSSEEKQKQSNRVIEKVLSLPSYQKSNRISIFLSIDNEINTEPIIRKIFDDGKQCFVPRYSKTKMEMVRLKSMEDWETLPLTPWKIKQPSLKENRENALETGGLDFIVAPGVAFTKEGKRMGHGGGYYDRFIESIRTSQSPPPTVVAVAFKEQVLPDIPTTDTDQIIDAILYDDQ